jgi:hypothetical protein
MADDYYTLDEIMQPPPRAISADEFFRDAQPPQREIDYTGMPAQQAGREIDYTGMPPPRRTYTLNEIMQPVDAPQSEGALKTFGREAVHAAGPLGQSEQ